MTKCVRFKNVCCFQIFLRRLFIIKIVTQDAYSLYSYFFLLGDGGVDKCCFFLIKSKMNEIYKKKIYPRSFNTVNLTNIRVYMFILIICINFVYFIYSFQKLIDVLVSIIYTVIYFITFECKFSCNCCTSDCDGSIFLRIFVDAEKEIFFPKMVIYLSNV